MLLRGPLLSEAERWLGLRGEHLTAEEQDFIRASKKFKEEKEQEAEEQRQRELEQSKRLIEKEKQLVQFLPWSTQRT